MKDVDGDNVNARTALLKYNVEETTSRVTPNENIGTAIMDSDAEK